jgi:hypothetical protein
VGGTWSGGQLGDGGQQGNLIVTLHFTSLISAGPDHSPELSLRQLARRWRNLPAHLALALIRRQLGSARRGVRWRWTRYWADRRLGAKVVSMTATTPPLATASFFYSLALPPLDHIWIKLGCGSCPARLPESLTDLLAISVTVAGKTREVLRGPNSHIRKSRVPFLFFSLSSLHVDGGGGAWWWWHQPGESDLCFWLAAWCAAHKHGWRKDERGGWE